MKLSLYLLLSIVFLGSCSPVNFLTHVKRTPKIYTQNFCCDKKVSHYLDKKTPWIVYSTKDDNPSFYNPGGKVILKKASYMESFLVIGKKGDFLQLIKYESDIIENNSLKNRKKINYYGWIHQENLLLSSVALTDIDSGRNYKMLVSIKNEKVLPHTKEYFSTDSVVLFKDPELLTPYKKIALHSIAYLYKKTEDRTKSFITVKPQMTPENAQKLISGWVSSSLIIPYGQYIYSKIDKLEGRKIFTKDKADTIITGKDLFTTEDTEEITTLQPISDIKIENSKVHLNTYLPVPVIDNDPNYIYGLSGNPLFYKNFKQLKKDLKHINIIFAFEDDPKVFENFSPLVNTLKQLQNTLIKDSFTFRVGAVIGFGKLSNNIYEISPSTDWEKTFEELETIAKTEKGTDSYKTDTWYATLRAATLLSKYKNDNNLIITIGGKGTDRENVDSDLIDYITKSNARILAYQIYADKGDSFNNFILQAQEVILKSAKKIIEGKKNILVNSNQLPPELFFVEKNENIYTLDFPSRSPWQGWILFPKKKEQLPLDILNASIDTLIHEIKYDSKNIIETIQKSFFLSGMTHSKINKQWLSSLNLPADFCANSSFFKIFGEKIPYSFFPISIEVSKENWLKGSHFLLLSEREVAIIRDFLSDLTKYQVDYKYISQKKQKTWKKSFLEDDGTETKRNPEGNPQYISTTKTRRKLKKTYYKWARYNKLYPMKKRAIRALSLSESQEVAIATSSENSILKSLKVRDIYNKKLFSDRDLDIMIEYFSQKKAAFEKAVSAENQIESNGEIFYKISLNNLP